MNHKQRMHLLLTLFFTFLYAGAQSLEQAKTLFAKKQYDAAKPAFYRNLKTKPSDANYNYWYGVCCLKTGEPTQAIKPLELAAKKNVTKASFYLGEAHRDLWQFEDAVKSYETYIGLLKKKNETTEETEKLLEESKTLLRMLKGVENVCIVDSFVTDKENFLEAYKISRESGKLHKYKDFFHKNDAHDGNATVYETELGNTVYYSERNANDTLKLYYKIQTKGDQSPAVRFPKSINRAGNVNYPFVLTDGVTVYYAADGEGSIGGYDIFATRYNPGAETYLAPENIGFPFNSPYNDYMYAIDEFNNLGWFASDRLQPEGKVCIYVFIPNKFKKTYNYESTDKSLIINAARLHSLKDTWKDTLAVTEAQARLEKVQIQKPKEQKPTPEFEFVIDDAHTYRHPGDFKSARAKELFDRYRQAEKNLNLQTEKLCKLRDQYAATNVEGKAKLAPGILDLEKRVEEMQKELIRQEIGVRNEEKRNSLK